MQGKGCRGQQEGFGEGQADRAVQGGSGRNGRSIRQGRGPARQACAGKGCGAAQESLRLEEPLCLAYGGVRRDPFVRGIWETWLALLQMPALQWLASYLERGVVRLRISTSGPARGNISTRGSLRRKRMRNRPDEGRLIEYRNGKALLWQCNNFICKRAAWLGGPSYRQPLWCGDGSFRSCQCSVGIACVLRFRFSGRALQPCPMRGAFMLRFQG